MVRSFVGHVKTGARQLAAGATACGRGGGGPDRRRLSGQATRPRARGNPGGGAGGRTAPGE
ncbi:hypothetical protein QJS66_06320 [Kocuria rhizophila]|nr:hypothetical protein QJS66_06320 [Kocuria rhizophila]